MTDCLLCHPQGELVIHEDAGWRCIRAIEPGFPLFYRVIAQGHVREWSEVPDDQAWRAMRWVRAIEQALLALPEAVRPHKVNLAQLGNVVPHVHWHVIGRREEDSHFPAPIWAAAQRPQPEALLAAQAAALAALDADIAARLAALP